MHVTGRASGERSKPANGKVAKERADEVVSLLHDEGVRKTRITAESAGSAGTTDEPAVLDAAWLLGAAKADSERCLPLPPAAEARYAIDEGSEAEIGGYFRVLRLRPQSEAV